MLRARRAKTTAKTDSRGEPFPLTHVAIIMDGNRRWADLKGLPRLVGHREGVKTLKQLVRYVGSNGLQYLTVYAFSSENWNRTTQEVSYLMELFAAVVTDELDELNDSGVRLRFLGQLSAMPKNLQESFRQATERTQHNDGLCLSVAINYGSRLEITEAIRQIAQDISTGQIPLDRLDEKFVSSRLYTKDMPDPDLIIRTGGEMRLSNYLLWQAAYSELYLTPVLWPDFSKAEFEKAMVDYAARVRRYGGD